MKVRARRERDHLMTMPSDESHTEVGPCHMLLGSQGRRTDKGTQQVLSAMGKKISYSVMEEQ